MKTRNVVAIGLLSALAVGILAIGLTLKKYKPQIMQTNATDYIDNTEIENGVITSYDFHSTQNETNEDWVTIHGNVTKTNNEYKFKLTRLTIRKSTGYELVNTIDLTSLIVPNPFHTTTLQTQITGVSVIRNDSYINNRGYNPPATEPPFYYTNLQGAYSVLIHTEANQTIQYKIFTFSEPIVEDIQTNGITITGDLEVCYINIENYLTDINYAYTTGYNSGLLNGTGTYNEGYQAGYTTGYTAGEETGYTAGYQVGADELSNGNFISLRTLMLNVLTMPFTFINQAFNLTLWENTPYAFNISTLIKTIIAVGAILFIIKMFTSGFQVIGSYTNTFTNTTNLSSDKKLQKSQIKLNRAKAKNVNKPQEKHVYIHKD